MHEEDRSMPWHYPYRMTGEDNFTYNHVVCYMPYMYLETMTSHGIGEKEDAFVKGTSELCNKYKMFIVSEIEFYSGY